MQSLVVFAPAKINLFLAVTGRRPDGFHDLVSLVATLSWGDTLWIESRAAGAAANTLACDVADVPTDESNLILKAARAFQAAADWRVPVHFRLEKRIPMGAGLGGGSSDAAAALRGLNTLAGQPLTAEQLAELAAGVGSDCALFLHDGPVVMRGRGERVTPLPPAVAKRLRGQRVLVFKPSFGVSTPWAYGQLVAAAPAGYHPEAAAEAMLAAWQADPAAPLGDVLFNSFETPVFAKFAALPALLAQLQARFGLVPRLSGSGSACFAVLDADAPVPEIIATIRAAWGESAVAQVATFV